MQILADRNIVNVVEQFSPIGDVRLVDGRGISAADLAGVDILLVRSVTPVDETLLASHKLRFVGSATSGIDHVDRELLARRGIPFAYAPGSNADSVVDYVLSSLINYRASLERLLDGGVMGLIGYGHIGRRMQQRMERLGIEVIACDPWLSSDEYPGLGSLEQVLNCDVVSLHAELTDRQPWPSRHLIGAAELAMLASGALLINTGRGELIDNRALKQALVKGCDWRVVLDVWEGEPFVDVALLHRVGYGSAHIAGYSSDGKRRATQVLLEACCSALDLDSPARPVNHAPLQLAVPPALHGIELLGYLVAAVYDIREDDRLLRAVAPGSFDQLRRTYRERRELNAVTIENLAELDREQCRLCEALLC